MKKNLLTVIITLACLCRTQAQEFKYLLEEELSSKLMSDIFQDSDGLIWIATDNGLSRFDGNKVKIYCRDDQDSLSLCHNLIYSVFEDHNGNIYVGNYLGTQLYNKKADNFSPKAKYENGEAFQETVNGFCELPDGTVCSFGDNGKKLIISETGELLVADIGKLNELIEPVSA